MLTIKLRNDHTRRISIVECESVDVEYVNGHMVIKAYTQGDCDEYIVSRLTNGSDVDPEANHVGFIEKDNGATSHVVRVI